MEFCNKGMVRADPPPVMVKDHKFTFFLDPSLSDSDNEIDSEVVNQIIESTINITNEDTVGNVTNMEYSNESDEDETSKSNNISSSQYFPECPVHNHHTDNDRVCPDDPPCSCMSEI